MKTPEWTFWIDDHLRSASLCLILMRKETLAGNFVCQCLRPNGKVVKIFRWSREIFTNSEFVLEYQNRYKDTL